MSACIAVVGGPNDRTLVYCNACGTALRPASAPGPAWASVTKTKLSESVQHSALLQLLAVLLVSIQQRWHLRQLLAHLMEGSLLTSLVVRMLEL